MTQQFPDHDQILAEFQRIGRKGMAEIVNADILQPGFLSDAPPRLLQISQVASIPKQVERPTGDRRRTII
ncbi:hypothetical protein A0U92_12565 [Acetobacter aceti]|uniref:Uncharacterized protein n=1 Tax=Acetobacter aceti TaxID=435 RepID=A0A1U9KI38_ACEAC|nr:hypothetical protein A0U92_12565 [Acetobacter aceti]